MTSALKLIIFLLIFSATTASAQELIFKGGGENSPWYVNSKRLIQDTPAVNPSETIKLKFGDKSCDLSEEGFLYFPVTLGFMVPQKGFAGTDRTLIGETISIDVVFTVHENKKHIVDLDKGLLGTPFSVGRGHRIELETLSTDRSKSAEEYVTGLTHALFLVRYYEEILNWKPSHRDRSLLEGRKTRYAVIVANLLMQLHKQAEDSSFYKYNPIIVPEGTAYNMLKSSLKGRPASLKTVTETRYRMFWYLSSRLTSSELQGKSFFELPEGLRKAARQLSHCLGEVSMSKDTDLSTYLKERGFYVPTPNEDLLATPSSKNSEKSSEAFNLWLNLYLRDHPNGKPSPSPPRNTILNEIFGE